jgi:hypothetical protein
MQHTAAKEVVFWVKALSLGWSPALQMALVNHFLPGTPKCQLPSYCSSQSGNLELGPEIICIFFKER